MGLAWGRDPASREVRAGFPHPSPPSLPQAHDPILAPAVPALL